MNSDPIADMLTRVRNAAVARLDRAEMPFSRLRERIADILVREGYATEYKVEQEHPAKLTVFLKYGRDHQSAIAGLRRRSRPGRRLYVGHGEIPTVHNGLGVAILSTSVGVITDRDARAKRVGGELLCEVW